MVTWRVDEIIKENPLNKNQHGFRSDKNTETAISANTDYIEQHIMYGKPVSGVSEVRGLILKLKLEVLLHMVPTCY